MLETIPKLESELEKLLVNYVEKAISQYAPVVSQIGRHRVFEGDRSVIQRETGEHEETDIQHMSGESTIKFETILYGSFEEILNTFLPAAESLASAQMQMIIDTLNKSTEKTGNVVDGKGEPLSEELLLEMYDKIELSFDKNGKHTPLTMLVPPTMRPRIEAMMLASDKKVYEEKLGKIIDRKRMEWRAREANRTLVG